MPKVDLALIQKLREITGLGMMDCKKALEDTAGDIEEAIELLRKKGSLIASQRSMKETAQGLVHAYIHPGSRLGVLVEINCETDFVASTEDLKKFAQDLCLHIAAMKPLYLAPEDVDPIFLEREKEVFKGQLENSGKPEKVINSIIDGKLNKLYSEICLLKQQFIKNDQLTVDDMLKELMAKTGENIKIRRFARYEIGA
ncbi:MAG TPA: translation elongation factor Ts [Candidatus Babeliales bacterium]|nr:translation elongation factor Ts [Candidatus Babeliales bacterium]